MYSDIVAHYYDGCGKGETNVCGLCNDCATLIGDRKSCSHCWASRRPDYRCEHCENEFGLGMIFLFDNTLSCENCGSGEQKRIVFDNNYYQNKLQKLRKFRDHCVDCLDEGFDDESQRRVEKVIEDICRSIKLIEAHLNKS